MDDIQLILYILFLIGYFIFKLITGKGKAGQQGQGQDTFDTENAPHAPRRQETRSLEEILEEIVTGERSEQRPKPVAPLEVQQENNARGSWYDDEETLSQYEKAVSRAQKHKTLQERVKEAEIKIGEVEDLDEAETENVGSNSYLGMFKNLEDTQKAVVMSEIINRRY